MHSAGVLVYKYEDDNLMVMLGHMGGPFWNHKDNGAWGIFKGEYTDESSSAAALREFNEETGFSLSSSDITYLMSAKVNSAKTVDCYVAEHDFNASSAVSNTFEIEWPKGSGVMKSFPEIDKVQWFTIDEAKSKITKGQLVFINTLESELNRDFD